MPNVAEPRDVAERARVTEASGATRGHRSPPVGRPVGGRPVRPPDRAEARVGEAAARRLSERLTHVHDPVFRTRVVWDFIDQGRPPVVAHGLETLARHSVHGDRPVRDAWCAVTVALAGTRPGYHLEAVLYRAATEQDLPIVRAVLLAGPGALRECRDEDMPYDAELDAMTLGARKWKARGHDVALLERLLQDGDAGVVANLLRNPRVTEKHVLRIASRRPTKGAVLGAVGASSRWIVRPSVQRALALNPYTPVRLATMLTPLMTRRELRKLRGDGTVHALVRGAAKALLEGPRPDRVVARGATAAVVVGDDVPTDGDSPLAEALAEELASLVAATATPMPVSAPTGPTPGGAHAPTADADADGDAAAETKDPGAG